MPTPLNKTNRGEIIAAIIKATFAERIDAIKANFPVIAQAAYMQAIPAKFLDLVKGNPPEWFCWSPMIDIHYLDSNGKKTKSKFQSFNVTGRYIDRVDLPGARAFPKSMVSSYSSPDVTVLDEDVLAMVKQQEEAINTLINERGSLRQSVCAIVNSVKTVEKLIEIAPELADYIPDGIKAPPAPALPAVIAGNVITQLMAAGLKTPKQ